MKRETRQSFYEKKGTEIKSHHHQNSRRAVSVFLSSPSEMKSLYRKVDSFDGQIIMVDGKPCYELGGFLGGGAAGVVYEVGLRASFVSGRVCFFPRLCRFDGY